MAGQRPQIRCPTYQPSPPTEGQSVCPYLLDGWVAHASHTKFALTERNEKLVEGAAGHRDKPLETFADLGQKTGNIVAAPSPRRFCRLRIELIPTGCASTPCARGLSASVLLAAFARIQIAALKSFANGRGYEPRTRERSELVRHGHFAVKNGHCCRAHQSSPGDNSAFLN
jgi:hypothetical protein